MPATPLISIVDDDDSARAAISGLVRALGFSIREFASGPDFLTSPDLWRTACLIADVRMPGMTGIDLYRHLIDSGTPIPTVLVTAYSDERARIHALNAGVRGYLTKPLVPDALLDCIRAALAHRAGGAE